MSAPRKRRTEWVTVALALVCYAVWALGTTWAAALWLPLGVALTTLAVALQSSLTHEAIHRHPFCNRALNAALVFPALGLLVPYLRFHDTHLAHHHDERLTDPYDDPETNYLDPAMWQRLPGWLRVVLRFNNTLFGRLLIGVAVSQVSFMTADWRAIRAGDRRVAAGWALHLAALVPVALWLAAVAQMPLWAYLVSAYAGLSILKIRTFLEHRANERVAGRTVIIEDRGLLAFLFLNNNLHAVHHAHPGVAWYRLPALYAEGREGFAERNQHYIYRSYAQVFRQHFLRAKDPVPHPLWR